MGAITKRVPKPLIKIDGKPFIDHLIKKLSQNGIEEVILLTGYKRNIFKKKYHNKILFNNTKVICSEEKKTICTLPTTKNPWEKEEKLVRIIGKKVFVQK